MKTNRVAAIIDLHLADYIAQRRISDHGGLYVSLVCKNASAVLHFLERDKEASVFVTIGQATLVKSSQALSYLKMVVCIATAMAEIEIVAND